MNFKIKITAIDIPDYEIELRAASKKIVEMLAFCLNMKYNNS